MAKDVRAVPERVPEARSNGSAGWLSRWFAHGPASPGDAYGAPGQGRSLAISVVTSLGLFLLWYGVTWFEWVPPLFLPSPQAVWDRIVEVAMEGFGGATLLTHTLTSMQRVFGAFFLAAVTAIPIGILMGVNRVLRGIFDPRHRFRAAYHGLASDCAP